MSRNAERHAIPGLVLLLVSGLAVIPATAVAHGTVEQAGTVLMRLIPAAALGATLLYEDGYDGTIEFAKAFATSQITTEVLKEVTHQQRPNNSSSFKSFPSGHTSAAFMGASFIQKRYGWKVSIPAYLGATFVGYSRVQANKHFVRDVIGGAAVGILSSYYFTTPYKGFLISPSVADGTYGVTVSKLW